MQIKYKPIPPDQNMMMSLSQSEKNRMKVIQSDLNPMAQDDSLNTSLDVFVKNHLFSFVPKELAGLALFPFVKTAIRSGLVLTFGGHDLELIDSERDNGADIKSVQMLPSNKPIVLPNHDFAERVPVEYASELGAEFVSYDKIAVISAFRKMMLRLEYDQAQAARNPANYAAENKIALTGSYKWSHADSSPSESIATGRTAIRNKVGHYPNVILLSDQAFLALKKHPYFRDKKEKVTPAFLSELWDIEEVFVGKAAYRENGIQDIWGNDVILAYTVSPEFPDLLASNYGCTYILGKHPELEVSYSREEMSHVYTLSMNRSVELNNGDAGYLIQSAT